MKRVILCRAEGSKTFDIDLGYFKETEKAYGVPVGYRDKPFTRRFDLYFPKSRTSIEVHPNSITITIPNWLLDKNLKPGQRIIERV